MIHSDSHVTGAGEAHQVVRRSRVAIAALRAVAGADLAAVLTGTWYVSYLRSLDPTEIIAELDLALAEAAYGIAGLAQTLALVTSAVCFILWFRRAYLNVEVFTKRATDHDAHWTIWGFFVPILNLIRPRQIMRETWDKTFSLWIERRPEPSAAPMRVDRVNLWWGLFLTAWISGNIASRVAWNAVTAQETLAATAILIAVNVADIAAAVVAIQVVRDVTGLQRSLLNSDVSGAERTQPV